ncbi:MAG TPA: PfkB family carbohydrate kinase [Gaiellaceae bacterium]|nr:PfkB family carbohydrate kinase [Gaiellaceae bacterium]
MPFVAVVGNLVKDVVAGAAPRPGGAVFYQATAFQRVAPSADVHLVTRCSAEDRELLVPPIEELGLPVTWRPGRETQAFSFHYEGERRVMDVVALGDPWTPDDVKGWMAQAVGDAEWIMVGALTRADFPPETLAALRSGGRQLLVDVQGFVRRGALGPLVRDDLVPPETFASVRGLKLNESEARVLVGSTEPSDLRKLCVPEVVLTQGSQGTIVVTAERAEHVPATPIDGTIDPTGAGDTFWVAYLVARSNGALPVEAARSASETTSAILASRATE